MTEPFAMMHRKNFRIIHANKETMKNDNFIGISKKQFERVNKDKNYGLIILKEEEQAKRMADYKEAEEYIASYNSRVEELPISTQIESAYSEEPKDFNEMTIQELRKAAKNIGLQVHTTNTKAEILEMISSMEAANGSEEQVNCTEC